MGLIRKLNKYPRTLDIVPVILAGGIGSRLWPLSRKSYPKQFLRLMGQYTCLQNTLIRLKDMHELADPIIVCDKDYEFIVRDNLDEIDLHCCHIILEPQGRNTAASIALAALFLQKSKAANNIDKDSLLLVLPADHYIDNVTGLQEGFRTGFKVALDEKIVTFGVEPTHAECGYGYIKKQESRDSDKSKENTGVFNVACFVEKPDVIKAQQYVKSGNYCWNSGMYLAKDTCILNELQNYAPKTFDICTQAIDKLRIDNYCVYVNNEIFKNCPEISIDHAVMEKTQKAVVIPLKTSWTDLGSWNKIWNVHQKNEDNNVMHGDVVAVKTKNSYLYSEDGLLTVSDINDMIIIKTTDATYVTSNQVKSNTSLMVDSLNKQKRKEVVEQLKVFRSWGAGEVIHEKEGVQIKRITINIGCTYSPQKDDNLYANIVVIRGAVKIDKMNKTLVLKNNESAHIPCGIKYTICNIGTDILEIILINTKVV